MQGNWIVTIPTRGNAKAVNVEVEFYALVPPKSRGRTSDRGKLPGARASCPLSEEAGGTPTLLYAASSALVPPEFPQDFIRRGTTLQPAHPARRHRSSLALVGRRSDGNHQPASVFKNDEPRRKSA
jgi:hypothetical protein